MCARFRRDFLHKNVDKNVNYVIYVCMTFGLNVSIFYAVDTNKQTNKQTRAAKIVLTVEFFQIDTVYVQKITYSLSAQLS